MGHQMKSPVNKQKTACLPGFLAFLEWDIGTNRSEIERKTFICYNNCYIIMMKLLAKVILLEHIRDKGH